jgi:hypothetical protein
MDLSYKSLMILINDSERRLSTWNETFWYKVVLP